MVYKGVVMILLLAFKVQSSYSKSFMMKFKDNRRSSNRVLFEGVVMMVGERGAKELRRGSVTDFVNIVRPAQAVAVIVKRPLQDSQDEA